MTGEHGDERFVRLALSAIEAEFANAPGQLAGTGMAAGALDARQIFEVLMPDDGGRAVPAEVPQRAPRRDEQRGEDHQDDCVEDAQEDDMALVPSEAVIPGKHQ